MNPMAMGAPMMGSMPNPQQFTNLYLNPMAAGNPFINPMAAMGNPYGMQPQAAPAPSFFPMMPMPQQAPATGYGMPTYAVPVAPPQAAFMPSFPSMPAPQQGAAQAAAPQAPAANMFDPAAWMQMFPNSMPPISQPVPAAK
jgi:hypothetical protein